jgi:Asp-tRNA(Asn)/Glu-tRNA(Gln) amidotransferase A subunit family amidase
VPSAGAKARPASISPTGAEARPSPGPPAGAKARPSAIPPTGAEAPPSPGPSADARAATISPSSPAGAEAAPPPGTTGSFAALAAALRTGRLPLAAYLDRLEAAFEEREPALHAFVPEQGRFERLRREARALAELHPRPADRPPLFGIALGVKDIFRVAGLPTRAGSRLPAAELAGREAASVRTLRRAGALVLGKTVTTEFAWFAPGPTRNPRDGRRTPGGSSSGSAAAVGAGLCPLALGSQTIGSIVRPASYCGVVGFKPSYGRIATAGVVPLAPSLDHVGLLTGEVAAARLAAGLLCRRWQPASASARRRPRLGIPTGPYLAHASAAGRAHFEAVCARLAAAGYAITTVPAFPDFEELAVRLRLLVAAEAARVHAAWYERHRELYDPRTAELIERGRRVSPAELARARRERAVLRRAVTALAESHRVDLWISPAAPGPAPRGLGSTGDPVMNLPWTYSGLPVLGLPAGETAAGLPMGLQLTGRWYGDEQLLAWGSALERALGARS